MILGREYTFLDSRRLKHCLRHSSVKDVHSSAILVSRVVQGLMATGLISCHNLDQAVQQARHLLLDNQGLSRHCKHEDDSRTMIQSSGDMACC
jgi:hypothetical protein